MGERKENVRGEYLHKGREYDTVQAAEKETYFHDLFATYDPTRIVLHRAILCIK